MAAIHAHHPDSRRAGTSNYLVYYYPLLARTALTSITGNELLGDISPGIRQLIEHILALPGVRAASGINHLPLAGDIWWLPFTIEGRAKPRPGESPSAVYRIVMPGYFETMGLPLRRGRDIQPSDDSEAPGVLIINGQAARRYWPSEDPIGKRITFNGKWLTVIGIAKDAKQSDWVGEIDSEVYLSALQNRDFLGEKGAQVSYITLVVRTARDPAAMSAAVQNVVWSFDRNLPISEIVTMDQVIAEKNAQPRFEMLVLGIFAAIALLLAAVGIYGVMSYSVSHRRHEIGIRLSLGASPASVQRMLVGQGMLLASSFDVKPRHTSTRLWPLSTV